MHYLKVGTYRYICNVQLLAVGTYRYICNVQLLATFCSITAAYAHYTRHV